MCAPSCADPITITCVLTAIGGFEPKNHLRGQHVLFLASFTSNDTTLSQFHVLVVLLESFIESLTILLPFYPTGTMERVTKEGTVATASTLARLFNALPSCGKPACLLLYDLHTLQNRFYLSGNCLAQLESAIPLLKRNIEDPETGDRLFDAIAFPDDGAAKRFNDFFPDYEIVICGKIRDGDRRIVRIQDGQPAGKRVLIVDDLVQTGGTLYEAGEALKAHGAVTVSAFCSHAVFPNASWRRFARGGDRAIFERFYVSNSIPTTVRELPKDDAFIVLDLVDQIMQDLA